MAAANPYQAMVAVVAVLVKQLACLDPYQFRAKGAFLSSCLARLHHSRFRAGLLLRDCASRMKFLSRLPTMQEVPGKKLTRLSLWMDYPECQMLEHSL